MAGIFSEEDSRTVVVCFLAVAAVAESFDSTQSSMISFFILCHDCAGPQLIGLVFCQAFFVL